MLGVRRSLGLLWGDFNVTRFMGGRQGCEGNINDMESFNYLIPDCLDRYPAWGRSFT